MQLKQICEDNNIQPGRRKKADLINHILKILNNPRRIEEANRAETGFNYKTYNWRTVMTMSILKMAVINSWVLFNESKRISLDEYLIEIITWLLNPIHN